MPTSITNKEIGERAMEIAELFELKEGRTPRRVHRDGVGYDLCSFDSHEERFIEVKGVIESWSTHTWQSMYKTEVEALNKYPKKFFLYIVHFEKNIALSENQLFVIPGAELLKSPFRIVPEFFALKPISQRRLAPYAVSVNKSGRENIGKDLNI